MAEEEIQNDSSVGRMKKFAQHIDTALYRLLDQRVAIILLVVAISESLAAPFLGTRWAIFGLATAGVAIGLILAGSGLWISALGNSAQKISQYYEQEVRGATAPQSKAAPERPLPRWRN